MTNEEWNAWSDRSWANSMATIDAATASYIAQSDAANAEYIAAADERAGATLDPCFYAESEAEADRGADCDY